MCSFPVLAIAVAAWGITSARAAAAGDPPEAAARAVRVVLSLPPGAAAGPGALAPERLRAALATELQRPVLADGAGAADVDFLTIALGADRALTVDYRPASGPRVVRTVRASGDDAEVAALALLLAGNVARDQAAELLGPSAGRRADASPAAAPLSDGEDPAPARPSVTQLADAAVASVAHAAAPAEDPEPPLLLGRYRVGAAAWVGTLSLLNVAFRASDERTYAQIGMSGHRERKDGDRSMAGPSLAMGVRVPFRWIAFENDVGVSYLHGLDELPGQGDPGRPTSNRLITRGRSALVFSAGYGISLFAGVGYAMTTHLHTAVYNEYGPELFGGVQL